MNHYTPLSVSISELKKNPTAIINKAKEQAVIIVSHNQPTAYLVSLDEYETLTGKAKLGNRISQRFAPIADDDFNTPARTDYPKGA